MLNFRRPVSEVPAEITDYHRLRARAEALADSAPLVALEALWQAFAFYLEADALELALRLLKPWPDLCQPFGHYCHLLYSRRFPRPAPRPATAQLPAELRAWQTFVTPPQRPRVSVCMIVRNERESLPRALASVTALADEIVVVDTGSSDGTQALAAAHAKVRLSHFDWCDDFAAARNAGLKQAQGDWILVIDADEELEPESRDYLQAFFAFPPLGWQIFTCQVEHRLAHNRFYSWTTRIFRRDTALRFSGALHELPRKFSSPTWLLQVALPGILRHSGNLPEVYARQGKSRRAQLLRTLVEDPRTRTPFLTYHYAHLLVNGIDLPANPALAERLLRETLAEAERDAERVTPPEQIPAAPAAVVLLLAQLLGQQGRHAELAELYARYAERCPVTAFVGLAAQAYRSLGQWRQARVAWWRAFDPQLLPMRSDENWQQLALEGLMGLGLEQHDGLLALWAVRRLRERHPDGHIPGRGYDLLAIQRQLEDLLSLERGTWLDRLEFELQQALAVRDIERVCFCAFAYLCEAWDRTILEDAVRALHVLGTPSLATAVAGLGRRLYPQAELFQLWGGDQPTLAAEADIPGGAYWLWLAQPPAIRPRVSLCLIVRNAADTLLGCLRSLEPVVDEYVIADTGSEDATPALIAEWARSHRVISWSQTWTDDFAAARNAVFPHASGDWVLIVDADERLTPESVTRLQTVLALRPAGLQLLAIRCASLDSNEQILSEDWVPRIYRRSELIRYWGAVHNYPGHARDAERLPVIPLSGVRLLHSGFSTEMVRKHRKHERLQRLEACLTIEGLPNPYYLYHYGYALMYQYQPPQLEKAYDVLLQSLDENQRWRQRPPVPGWFVAPAGKVRLLVFRLLAHWQHDAELLNRYADWPESQEAEYHYWYACAALRQGQLAAARAGYTRCLLSEEADRPQAGFGSWKALLGLTEAALQAHDWSAGIEAFQALLAHPGPLQAQRLFSEWWMAMLVQPVPNSDSKRGASAS